MTSTGKFVCVCVYIYIYIYIDIVPCKGVRLGKRQRLPTSFTPGLLLECQMICDVG